MYSVFCRPVVIYSELHQTEVDDDTCMMIKFEKK